MTGQRFVFSCDRAGKGYFCLLVILQRAMPEIFLEGCCFFAEIEGDVCGRFSCNGQNAIWTPTECFQSDLNLVSETTLAGKIKIFGSGNF